MKNLLEKVELEKLDKKHLTLNDIIIIRFPNDMPFDDVEKIHRSISSSLIFNKVIALPKDIEITCNSKEETIEMLEEIKEFVKE